MLGKPNLKDSHNLCSDKSQQHYSWKTQPERLTQFVQWQNATTLLLENPTWNAHTICAVTKRNMQQHYSWKIQAERLTQSAYDKTQHTTAIFLENPSWKTQSMLWQNATHNNITFGKPKLKGLLDPCSDNMSHATILLLENPGWKAHIICVVTKRNTQQHYSPKTEAERLISNSRWWNAIMRESVCMVILLDLSCKNVLLWWYCC